MNLKSLFLETLTHSHELSLDHNSVVLARITVLAFWYVTSWLLYRLHSQTCYDVDASEAKFRLLL